MKLTKFFLMFLFAAIAVAGFSQRGLQAFTDLKTGADITYNRDNIVRAYPTTQGTKLWFNSGNPTDVSDVFANVIADDPGGLIQFMYVNKSGTLKFIALNPDYIVKAYGFNSDAQTVAIMRDGNTFLIDTTYSAFTTITSTALPQEQGIATFANPADTLYYKVPVGAKSLTIQAVGAGGGGGSGRRGAAASARGGGSGGGSGAYSQITIDVSSLGNDSLGIITGLHGSGGAAVTANTTNGNDGTDGGATKVIVLAGPSSSQFLLLIAGGGSKGLGGSNASVAGGAGGTIGDFLGKAGGAGDTTGVAGTSSVNMVAGGGGGGGGVGVTNVNRAGGGGGNGWYGIEAGGTGGAAGAAGTTPVIDSPVAFVGGGGSGAGGGGFSGRVGTAGAGGGGGSASANGTNSGAGGNGGDGYVRIIANY